MIINNIIKISSYKDDAYFFLADFNFDLLQTIKHSFEGMVGVLGGHLNNWINAFYDYDSCKSEKLKALDALKTIVAQSQGERVYYSALDNWNKQYLAKEGALKDELTPMYTEILRLKRECWIGTSHRLWEHEFTMLLGLIHKHEYNNASFDFMRLRLLYANKAAMGTLDGDKILSCIQSISKPTEGPIRSFGVDIQELWNELHLENYEIDRLLDELD